MQEIVSVVALIVYYVLLVFFFMMWGRLAFEMVMAFGRGWRPRGFTLVLAEIVFTVTDPPLKLVRRFIKPLRLGGIAIDLGWMIIMFACIILMSIAAGLV